MSIVTKDANLVDRTVQTTLEGSEHLPHSLVKGKATDYSPFYNGPESTTKREFSIDPDGYLNTRGPVTSDEGSNRINFSNSSLAVSMGAVTVSGSTVTGSGFLSLFIDKGDYFKISTDTETSLVQIESIDSDTQITLAATYSGSASGTGERWIMQTVTGSGDSIAVSSGQCVITSGTTANAISEVKRLIDYSPINANIGFSVSQRIANQEWFIGFRDPSSTIKYFQWFRLTGTSNTVIDAQSGYNSTGAPSAAETQSITGITLPNGLTTASIIQYRIETSFDRIRFYAKSATDTSGSPEFLLCEINRVAPHPNDPLELVIRKVNGATPPASTTTGTIDFVYAKNFNKQQVEQSGNQEGMIAIAAPGQIITGTAATGNNQDILVLDLANVNYIAFQTTGTFTATVSFQASNDPTFAQTTTPYFFDTANSSIANSGTTLTNRFFKGPRYFRYLRFRTTAYTSGNPNVICFVSQQPTFENFVGAVQSGTWTVQPGNTANTTAWLVNDIPNAAQGHSTHHSALNTAASSMATNVKGSAGVIGEIVVSNNNATTAFFFKLYNKATAPIPGTDTPVQNFRIPAGQTVTLTPNKGKRLASGIGYAVTSGAPLLDTGTVTTANDIMVNINYT